MADQLNMGGLSLGDSQHAAPHGMGAGRSAYIPPHLRGQAVGPTPAQHGGMGGSTWAAP